MTSLLCFLLILILTRASFDCEARRVFLGSEESEDALLVSALRDAESPIPGPPPGPGPEDYYDDEPLEGEGLDPYSVDLEPLGHEPDEPGIKFLLYTGNFTDLEGGTQIYIGNKSHLLASGFDVTAPTKIISHGYMSSYRRGPGKLLIPAYFEARKGQPLNIISINWSGMSGLFRSFMKKISFGLYFPPARNSEIVGNATGAMIEFLVKDVGMNLTNFHLIGHSLGAHVMGYAGRYLISRFNRSVARITALDPAGPCFETFRRACFRGKFRHISRNDADFVDAIHTHAWALGMKKPVGHVDFYPNGGFRQPGCFKLKWGALFKSISGLCSHKRAIELMQESILNDGYEIRAYPCNDVNAASKGTCTFHSDEFALLGEPCSPSSKGIYFLRTNARFPFISLIHNLTHFNFRF